jgi:GntR family transcriptional repressor for pyruvate dehydrogenase complex
MIGRHNIILDRTPFLDYWLTNYKKIFNWFDNIEESMMAKRKQSRGPLQGIAEKLWRMILDVGMEVGDRLPPERVLAEKFGVTRGVVRLGIQSLAERGILVRRQGDGTYISSVSTDAFVKESMAMAIRVQSDLLAEVLEFRKILEPQTASLAAGRISKKDLDALKIMVCDQQLPTRAGDGGLDAAFHLKLAECSGNSVLFRVMSLIDDMLAESRADRYQSDERRMISIAGHLKIIDALEEKNPDKAFTAMQDHLEQVESVVTKNAANTKEE